MTSESEIRAIIALQQEIEQKKSEVSKRLDALRQENEKVWPLRFVIDGKLGEMERWDPEGAIRPEHFRAWKLVNKGPIESMSKRAIYRA
jgi:hypothetical protein